MAVPSRASERRRVLLVWRCCRLGCQTQPKAPALIDEPVYQSDEGFRFLVPEGWIMAARRTVPPGPVEKERLLVQYRRADGDKQATLEVSLADLPEDTDLASYLSGPRSPPATGSQSGTRETLEVGGVNGTRLRFLAGAKGTEMAKEVTPFAAAGVSTSSRSCSRPRMPPRRSKSIEPSDTSSGRSEGDPFNRFYPLPRTLASAPFGRPCGHSHPCRAAGFGWPTARLRLRSNLAQRAHGIAPHPRVRVLQYRHQRRHYLLVFGTDLAQRLGGVFAHQRIADLSAPPPAPAPPSERQGPSCRASAPRSSEPRCGCLAAIRSSAESLGRPPVRSAPARRAGRRSSVASMSRSTGMASGPAGPMAASAVAATARTCGSGFFSACTSAGAASRASGSHLPQQIRGPPIRLGVVVALEQFHQDRKGGWASFFQRLTRLDLRLGVGVRQRLAPVARRSVAVERFTVQETQYHAGWLQPDGPDKEQQHDN